MIEHVAEKHPRILEVLYQLPSHHTIKLALQINSLRVARHDVVGAGKFFTSPSA